VTTTVSCDAVLYTRISPAFRSNLLPLSSRLTREPSKLGMASRPRPLPLPQPCSVWGNDTINRKRASVARRCNAEPTYATAWQFGVAGGGGGGGATCRCVLLRHRWKWSGSSTCGRADVVMFRGAQRGDCPRVDWLAERSVAVQLG
jgi:hypothetical protein